MSSPPTEKEWAGFTRATLEAGAAVLTATADVLSEDLALIAREWVTCLKAGGKILLFGNGGSHADAQHLAGELVNRFRRNRPGMAALALGTSVPILTSVANDTAFETDEVDVRVYGDEHLTLFRPRRSRSQKVPRASHSGTI